MSSNSDPKTASTATFLTALTFNAIVFAAQLSAFVLLKPYFKRIYEPRALEHRIHSLSFLSWPIQLYKADYRAIIRANGLDSYFFTHFLRMLVKMFLPIWVISWAVLIPLTTVNSRVGQNDGLDRLTFGNIEPTLQARFAGHIICAYLFTAWILYIIKDEMRHFVITRQHHLIDSIHAKSVQASTVLVTGIPARYLNQEALRKVFGALPGGVKKIWINRNLKHLPDVYDRRLNACNKLEAAETKLLSTAAKLRAKQVKKGEEPKPIDRESVPRPTHKLGFLGLFGEKVDSIDWARKEINICTALLEEARKLVQSADDEDSRKGEALIARGIGGGWNNEKADVRQEDDASDEFTSKNEQDKQEEHAQGSQRPDLAHQLSQHAAHEASELPKKTAQQASALSKQVVSQAAHLTHSATTAATSLLSKKGNKEYPPLNSAFITFHKQIAAHMAMQSLTHHEPYRMSGRYIEVSPSDVIWGNLGLNPYEMKVRLAISWGATLALIVFWAIPVAFVGIVSNVYAVCSAAKWLAWICNIGPVAIGIISGVLPPVLLAVLMMLLPIVLRLFARFEGIPQQTGCELSLMHRYFAFQVVHTFLIVTLSAGIVASLKSLLNNPTSIPTLLATKLPQASTFFLTYALLQLASTAGGFLQVVALIIYYVKLFILGSTPRSIWLLKYAKRGIGAWGTIWPGITVVVVISFGYSVIAPVINGIACAFFFLSYLLYKYLFLWVIDQSQTPDTGGLFFPKALQHLFVGLYVQQICLCALFFLARNESGHAGAVPEGALMVVLIVLTAAFHMILNNSYGPLLHALPLTLADKMYETPEVPIVDPSVNDSTGHGQDVEPAPLTNTGGIEAEHIAEEKEGFGFAHPAVAYPQRTIWIPNDHLGWAHEEEEATRKAGVDVVMGSGATMNESGSVEVDEEPGIPGQD